MPLPLQLPPGSIVLNNRFGDGPFEDRQRFVDLVLPQGVELEGVYNAARGKQPPRFWLYAFALWHGQRSHKVGYAGDQRRRGKAMVTTRESILTPTL
jgi:hypothetical protein